MIEIINKTEVYVNEKDFIDLGEKILFCERNSTRFDVCVTFCSGDVIQNLNKKYRGVNKKTDVLSFETDIPGVPFIGDIIIDIDVADEQKGAKSLAHELQVLFIHGLLHLLGNDHIKTKDKEIMEKKEKKYRKYIKGE
ncbi:MAG: rRNA maturation RNase YbeY [Candidatus Cloacimonadota bacterium]|nr:MAG: rRNA maturation RNase YbeY [Candidatus Cloacimonadota bacterium]